MRARINFFISSFLISFIIFLLGCDNANPRIKKHHDARIERLENTHDEILRRLESIEESQKNYFVSAIDRVKYAIVHIITHDINDIPRGGGSGIVIDKTRGYILTNYHVIENAESIRVIFPNRDPRDDIAEGALASIVGYDRLSDLTLLKSYDELDSSTIEWGNSKNLQVGEWAIAIGYPYAPTGQANPTVTAGIISATSRNFLERRLHIEMIQTDASINPGSSGGALINIYGQVIGINTFISTSGGGAEGVGFAIPADTATKVIEQLIEHGCVIPPYLGIHTQPVTRDLLRKLKIPFVSGLYALSHPRGLEDDGKPNYAGVFIAGIDEGSPANNAGIEPGDFIESSMKNDVVPSETEPTIIFNAAASIENERHFKAMTRLLPINQKRGFFLTRPIFDPSFHVEISGPTFTKTEMKSLYVELQPEVLQWNYTPPGWGITFKQPSREDARKYTHRGVIVTSIIPENTLATALRSGDLVYKIVSKKVKIVTGKKKPLMEFEIHSLEEFKIYAPMLTSGEQFWFHFERDRSNESKLLTIPKN